MPGTHRRRRRAGAGLAPTCVARGRTYQGREAAPSTTRGVIAKALRFLADQGFLARVSDEYGGTYRTTPRYQVQVRELAAERAFAELLSLGVVVVTDPSGSLHAVVPGRREACRCMSCPGAASRRRPEGARYQDVTLDLRRGLSGEPSDASVLFLENGGGKTVLVRLIFSVILPGRRQIVGTSNSKMLEKFVLASDVAHVALEWRDTQTGDLLVTGKASEWRGHVVSADSNRLTERWYTFRPTETLDLGTLPLPRTAGSSAWRIPQRLTRRTGQSGTAVRWVDRQGEWTEHLDSLLPDPELFYQRKMHAGRGRARMP